MVKKVTREELDKGTWTENTKGKHLLKGKGSRQEKEPILGRLVDLGMAEPLHNANNAWAYMHCQILEIALSQKFLHLALILRSCQITHLLSSIYCH